MYALDGEEGKVGGVDCFFFSKKKFRRVLLVK